MKSLVKNYAWVVFVGVVTAIAGSAARKAATTVWSSAASTDAPPNPADASVTWTSALGWAGLAGLAAGLARVLGQRGAVAAWKTVTNELPPGITSKAA